MLYQYYKALCDELDIGIAMWSHPDCGYLMQPEECRAHRRAAKHRGNQVLGAT